MKLKNYISILVMATLIVFNSCKKDTIDVTQLLATVPSSAGGVVVLNVEELLEDAGCDVKDHQVTPGQELMEIIRSNGDDWESDALNMFAESAGIDIKNAVIFYDAKRSYLTFSLYDVNKFIEYIEKKNKAEFTKENGVKVYRNVAVKGAQAWVCMSSSQNIDTNAVDSYSSLEPSQSFLVNPMGEKLLKEENDIRGWGLINVFTNEMMDRGSRGMFNLGLGFLFEEAKAVGFKCDFKEGELEMEVSILDKDGNPAKYLLPTEKVDVETLKSLGTTCNAMMAFTVNSDLIKKFHQIGESFGGALFGDLESTLKNVDGTVGLIGTGDGIGGGLSGVITTKGDITNGLRNFISDEFGPVSMDGKYLRISNGEVKGNLSVSECAEELKGSCLGMVMDPSSLVIDNSYPGIQKGFKSFVIKMIPESKGLELEFELKTASPDENALLTLIKSVNG